MGHDVFSKIVIHDLKAGIRWVEMYRRSREPLHAKIQILILFIFLQVMISTIL